MVVEFGYGKDLKNVIIEFGNWWMFLLGFGECLFYYENKMMLDYDKFDKWGLLIIIFDVEWKENEYEMWKDMV